MSALEDYFREKSRPENSHPLLRNLEEMLKRSEFMAASVEVQRPKDTLGHKPARLYLHYHAKSGEAIDRPYPEEWDDELNQALIKRHIKAINHDNESVRFSLGLRAALQSAESKFGDGYYNAVLVHFLENSPFHEQPALNDVLKHVYRSGIDPTFRTYSECRDMIDGAIKGRARELVDDLEYGIEDAGEILSAALADYLDERFSVSNRKSLGFL